MRFDIPILSFLLAGLAVSCSSAYRNIKIPEPVFASECIHNAYFVNELCKDEKEYLDWANKFPAYPLITDLTRDRLSELARQYGIDEAAALIYNRIITDPKNKALYNYLENQKTNKRSKQPDVTSKHLTLVFIPGMFYRSNKDFDSEGSNIRRLAEKIGYRTDIIRVNDTGTVQDNAIAICDYLEGPTPGKLVMATLSKGASDLKTAFARCGKSPHFRKIIGWFNIVGLTKGTQIANFVKDNWTIKLYTRIYFWWKGYDYNGILSMQSGPSTSLDPELLVPNHIRLLNIMAVPIRRTVSEKAMPYYDLLAPYGPNDGIGLLADMYLPGGHTWAYWRSDHYFFQPISDTTIISLLAFMAEGLD
ncbi:hypothetical protein LPTSP3_g06670 [Leptospira kobayashii]|uniref:Lipoprotein n=1 Tax=Leptospira kobayashii TaxID=1917830 RepID=A0ABN6K9V5_9LEPT|nr:hypothetical protein [Leptospira kobayashii]BDA77737.1 hypothetical protein LPTSP3_g06670 [Leptospira kobayashii]